MGEISGYTVLTQLRHAYANLVPRVQEYGLHWDEENRRSEFDLQKDIRRRQLICHHSNRIDVKQLGSDSLNKTTPTAHQRALI